jgi:hypothetical protein
LKTPVDQEGSGSTASAIEHAATVVDILRETNGSFVHPAQDADVVPDDSDTTASDTGGNEFIFSSLQGRAKADIDEQAVSRTLSV